MVSFQLTAEQQQLRDTVGQFAREVSPQPAAVRHPRRHAHHGRGSAHAHRPRTWSGPV